MIESVERGPLMSKAPPLLAKLFSNSVSPLSTMAELTLKIAPPIKAMFLLKPVSRKVTVDALALIAPPPG